MNAKKTKLSKPSSNDLIAQFRAVGVDENGKTLYQKVDFGEQVDSTTDLPVPSIKKIKFQVPPEREAHLFRKEYENMTPELRKLKHDQSVAENPELDDLHDEEFVITKIERHPLGGLLILVSDIALIVIMVVFWLILVSRDQVSVLPNLNSNADLDSLATLVILSLVLMSAIFGWVAYTIYTANKLFITSERLIQFVAKGLFDRKEQSIDLTGIEDVSYHQRGIMATFFNYGNIRMSTIGDESTYTLNYVENPNAVVNNVMEIIQAVKNDRPIPAQFNK